MDMFKQWALKFNAFFDQWTEGGNWFLVAIRPRLGWLICFLLTAFSAATDHQSVAIVGMAIFWTICQVAYNAGFEAGKGR